MPMNYDSILAALSATKLDTYIVNKKDEQVKQAKSIKFVKVHGYEKEQPVTSYKISNKMRYFLVENYVSNDTGGQGRQGAEVIYDKKNEEYKIKTITKTESERSDEPAKPTVETRKPLSDEQKRLKRVKMKNRMKKRIADLKAKLLAQKQYAHTVLTDGYSKLMAMDGSFKKFEDDIKEMQKQYQSQEGLKNKYTWKNLAALASTMANVLEHTDESEEKELKLHIDVIFDSYYVRDRNNKHFLSKRGKTFLFPKIFVGKTGKDLMMNDMKMLKDKNNILLSYFGVEAFFPGLSPIQKEIPSGYEQVNFEHKFSKDNSMFYYDFDGNPKSAFIYKKQV